MYLTVENPYERNDAMAEINRTLSGRYQLDKIISSSESATVYRAYDLGADRVVRAVRQVSGDTDKLEEARCAYTLMGSLFAKNTKYNFIPNVIQQIDEEDDDLYIVMEYVQGENLGELAGKKSISNKKTIEYAKDMCTFISFMHEQKYTAGTLDPDNILVIKGDESSSRGGKSKRLVNLKFIDFYHAKPFGEKTVSFSPEYASPEQFKSRFEDILPDEKTDIFNLGAAVYYLASGNKPLPVYKNEGNDPEDLRSSAERFDFQSNKSISPGLKMILQKCLNDDPEKRYSSTNELYKALEDLGEKKAVKKASFLLCAAVLFLAAGSFSAVQAQKASLQKYDYYFDNGNKSNVPMDKIDFFEKAIQTDPKQQEAYLKLIDACCYSKNGDNDSESMFSSEEKAHLMRVLSENKELLIRENIYEKIIFEYGKLIWYHEEYGLGQNDDNRITRMRDAAPYFQEAIMTAGGTTLSDANRDMAQTYYNIGNFYNSILNSDNKDNMELYTNFWNDLHNMIDYVVESSESKNDLIKLETFRTSIDALGSYSYYFNMCGIGLEEQIEFYDLIEENIDKCEPDESLTQLVSMKEEIVLSCLQCLESINITFGSNPDYSRGE